MRNTRRTTRHLAKNSVVELGPMLAPSSAYWLPFWPIHPPASAVHTMKARGDDDDDEDSNDSNNSTNKVWDEDEDEDDEQ